MYLVVDVVARDGVGVHEEGAALRGAWRALGDVRVVLGAPVVAELVGSHEVRLSGDHPLSVVVPTRTQPRVQVQCVSVLEVLCQKQKPTSQFLVPILVRLKTMQQISLLKYKNIVYKILLVFWKHKNNTTFTQKN